MNEEKPKRKHDSRWPDRTVTERSKNRRKQLDQIAIATGYETWNKLTTAVLKGEVVLRKLAQE